MRRNRLTLALVMLLAPLPIGALGFMLTTSRPESDDDRIFERAVRMPAWQLREKLRDTWVGPVINAFSKRPRRSDLIRCRPGTGVGGGPCIVDP